jgi:SAM-dependent methyltransferase
MFGFGAVCWAASCGCAVALVGGALWPVAAGAWRRLETPLHPDQARALPPESQPAGRDVLLARTTILVLAGIACFHHWQLPTPAAWSAAIIASLWLVMTWRPLLTAAVVGGGLVAAIFVPAAIASPWFPAALVAAQALPALAWSAQLTGRQPALTLVGLVAFATAVPLAPAQLAIPALLMGAAGWAAIVAARRRPLAGGPPLRLARRAACELSPYWRHYLRGKLMFDPLYRQLAADATRWGRVLDAGCGPGLVAMLAAGRADTEAYCGIDLDEDKLVVARRLLGRCGRPLNDRWQLLQGRLPLPQPLPSRFDTVFLLDVLHYWPSERQGELLAQLRGALVPGGRLWLREGIATSEGNAGLVALGERFTTLIGLNPGTGHLVFPTREALEAQLAAAGFRVEECIESGRENRLFRCVAI